MAEILIRARADGLIVDLLRGGVRTMPRENDPPTQALSFDDETNAATASDLIGDPIRYRLLAGVLRKDGTPVVIAADGEGRSLERMAADIDTQFATYLALATPTNAQIAAEVKLLTRVVRQLAKRALAA